MMDNEFDKRELIKSLERVMAAHDIAVVMHVDPLADMLMHDPDRAIEDIIGTYNGALNQAYDGVPAQAKIMMGGPKETIPWAIYNAIGAAYPYFEREQKDRALKKIFKILDGINYGYINGARGTGYTTGIREPLLLSDIAIARPRYWPGLRDQEDLWKGKGFDEIKEEIIDKEGLFNTKRVNSDFLVAYALLRSDFTNMGKDYVEVANPRFLNRVLKGIAGLRFGSAENEEEIEQGKKRLKELLPPSTHERIEFYEKEREWADYAKFNRIE